MTATGAGSDAQAVIDNAIIAAGGEQLDDEVRTAFVLPDGGQLAIVEPLPDSARDAPRRVVGTTTVLDVGSFDWLYAKYAGDFAETYADLDARTITTVINADGDNITAGHRDHRLVLHCKPTSAWDIWTGRDGRLQTQTDFAEMIEDRLPDIVDPAGATMLELAQSFEATTGVAFKSVAVLSSSARSLQYEETVAARAGQKGDIEIPAYFDLGLTPFDGGPGYRIRARFRYRISDGRLLLGYKLERPEDVLREAFDDVRKAVAEATGASVLLGAAPRERR